MRLMSETDLPSHERSQLSGSYADKGMTVLVEIFHLSGSDSWRMEVSSLDIN